MLRFRVLVVVVAWFVLSRAAVGFNGHRVTEGPLTLTIEKLGTVTERDVPQDVRVVLDNGGDAALAVALKMRGLVDEWRAVGETEQSVTVEPGGSARATFQIAAGPECLSALYPVHVYATLEHDGKKLTAHAVEVFETDFREADATARAADLGPPPLIIVPKHGAVPLATRPEYRVVWKYYDGPEVAMPVGWEGTHPDSRASFHHGGWERGQTKRAINMHPPYVPGGGSIFAEYRLKLPDAGPIKLEFYNAIRDNGPTEPPSDGVTFRVWADGQVLFERHTGAKEWSPGEADLTPLAGREITLRLESHPGPAKSTTCDSSYWGEPVVIAGPAPKMLSDDEKRQLIERAVAAVSTGKAEGESVFTFDLDGGCHAAVVLGPNGLADGALAFGCDDRTVALEGLSVAVLGQPVGAWPSAVLTEGVDVARDDSGRLRVVHRLRAGDGPFELTAEIWAEGVAVRVKLAATKRITDIAPGPADQTAARVYYGHGFAIDEPEPFRAYAGGHNLATSHVGFDFPSGVSLLTACDTPPDYLLVDPDERLYALHTHPDATLTFVPGTSGALDCAVRYRPLYDKEPAPAVGRKAGRFVFDIWGGRYADDAAMLEEAFRYGLTDSMVIMHVWQRWGYDYRLPDIYPPDPGLGTVEEMQALAILCADRDVPFGLHDNYIDFYPDAEDYSYDHIVFTEDGRPQKAWINLGRDAQSYRWRPDHILPFVRRNMDLIAPSLHPTAYFIDVFTSISSFDYYDRSGQFHSNLETRRCWGEAFDAIRDTLGGDAPMCSEAGGDHLVGHVDGADCQFLQLDAKPRRFRIRLGCRDWERVPWFDAVNHTRFSLHGVGYSGRYQGGRSRPLHGIESDDYLSAEVLTGHALMIDRPGLVGGAVRKYWLAQDVIRSLARYEIASVEFADGDLHRQTVTWKSGARVYVNRASGDWEVAGRVLPQYGYWARSGPAESSIERIGGAVVEQSRGPGRFYVNGRGLQPGGPLPIRPSAERVEYLGGRRFKLLVNWDATGPAPKDLSVFMHFFQPQVSRLELTGFYGGGGYPDPPTSGWKGRVTTGKDWAMTVPEDVPPGEYEVLVGLWDPEDRPSRRYRLVGDEDPEQRYRLGTLVIEGTGDEITGVHLEPPATPPELISRLAPNPAPVDFGVAETLGAFRCEIAEDRLTVTPLPGWPAFEVRLRLGSFLDRTVEVGAVEAIDREGKKTRDADSVLQDGELRFTTRQGDFAYRIPLGP